MLPTPAVNDMGAAYTPETWDEWTAEMKAKHSNGNGHGKSLNVEVQRLLPTPTVQDAANNGGPSQFDRNTRPLNTEVLMLPTPRATDGSKGGPNQRGSSGDLMLPSAVNLLPTPSVADMQGGRKSRSGDRSDELLLNGIAAFDRWGEYGPAIRRCESVTRRAPEPTKLNSKGNPKLSDEFDEWLMMLPAGWITDVPGITWNEVLKACGNGVVPPQCVAGLHYLRQLSAAH